MIAVIADEAAVAAAHADLLELVREHVQIFLLPVMRQEATAELVDARRLLGKNPGKNGALAQTGIKGALTHFRQLQSPLGEFMSQVDAAIAGMGDEVNAFMRLNGPEVRRLPPRPSRTDRASLMTGRLGRR